MKTILLALNLGLTAVVAQPVITNQPLNQTAIAGTTARFTVGATGAPPLGYQWRSYANPITFTNIPFGTEATLALTNVQPTSRRFAVVVTDSGGLSATSSPLVTLTVGFPPAIIQQPARQLVEVGSPVAISVTATGTPPLSYQWLFNGQTLAGQTRTNLTWASVQLSNAGAYSVLITNSYGSTNSQVATLTVVPPVFTKVTTGPIVSDLGYSAGGSWVDYNNDGLLDLFVFNGMDGVPHYPYLYRNNGDRTFTAITSGPPFNVLAESYSACWSDYDNDGYLDLLMSTGTGSLLFRNNGDGTFDQITNNPALATFGVASWVDYNNDGLLDLFLPGLNNAYNSLYRNNGDGTFSSITNSTLATERGSFVGSAWADYDNDGNLDVFLIGQRVAGIPQLNRLYHNNGDGNFTRITSGSMVNDLVDRSASCAWGDYDNDGFLDLFVANRNGPNNFLYHNNGDGTFTRITNGIIVNDPANSPPGCDCGSYGCAWGDYDNDGFLDLFVTNEGPPDLVPTVVNFLYHNNGDGTFTKFTTGKPVTEYSDSWGSAWGDYDNDGFLDLFASRGDGRGNYLYHNIGNSNGWLTVKLIGTVSNRSAIGAQVRVKATVGGMSRWQLRQIAVGGVLHGHDELWAHFGLGDATNIDVVRIEWPSGAVQELNDAATNQILTITEPARLLAVKTNGTPQFAIKGGRGFHYQIDTSTNLIAWASLGNVTITNQNGTARIIETNTSVANQRFYRAVSR